MCVVEGIHQRAVQCANGYKKGEAALLSVLIEVLDNEVHLKLGYPNLFKYCMRALGLTEAQAWTFIGVARKSKEVPELKAAIDEGKMGLSNARQLVSVINQENKDQWLNLGQSLSHRDLQREIKNENPEALPKDRVRVLNREKSELKCVIGRDLEKKLARIRDLVSQKKSKAATMEDALEMMADLFLKREDPIERAKRVSSGAVKTKGHGACDRASVIAKSVPLHLRRREDLSTKGGPAAPLLLALQKQRVIVKHATRKPRWKFAMKNGKRTAIPAATFHRVNERDERACQFMGADGKKCGERRWVEVHHRVSVSRGGQHVPENLVTLCSGHHRLLHSYHARNHFNMAAQSVGFPVLKRVGLSARRMGREKRGPLVLAVLAFVVVAISTTIATSPSR